MIDSIKICQEVKALLQEGEYFTFENFSTQRVRNLPAKLSPEWVSWHNRVHHLITSYFPRDSNPYILLKEGIEICLIGAKKDKFETAKSYINQALEEAIEFITNHSTNDLMIAFTKWPQCSSKQIASNSATSDTKISDTNQKEVKIQNLLLTPKIFISHTPRQEKLVERLVSVFESALNVRPGDIRCTSLPSYAFAMGNNRISQLRTEIQQAEMVIGIIAPDSLKSNVLFELGAAWGFQKSIFLLLAGGATINCLPTPLQQLSGIILTDTVRCHELVDLLVRKTTIEKKENVNPKVAGAIHKLVEISRGEHNMELQDKEEQNSLERSQNADITEIAKLLASRPINPINIENKNTMTEESKYNLSHAQFTGGFAETVEGNQIGGNINNYALEKKQSLVEAATEIRALLEELEKSYPTNTTTEKMIVAAKAIDCIESDPTLKHRVMSAVKEGGLKAFEKAIDNPIGAFVAGAIQGWQDCSNE